MNRFKSILDEKYYQEASVFNPENLLREARRQKNLSNCNVPQICILDPDGDIVCYLKRNKKATLNKCWACYHTELYSFDEEGVSFGIIGCAVGASFAVLLAEQLFVSGCELLISITSAGQISARADLPRFLVIEKALRDEGTSYHYVPPSTYTYLNESIASILAYSFDHANSHAIDFGTSWTTDAPYRETASAIRNMQAAGIDCVEMESSALYAFAQAKRVKIICLAHLTNSMAQREGDFEKGEEFGSIESLKVIQWIAERISTI